MDKTEITKLRAQLGTDFKSRQEKFGYYLMGLNTAAIGFALSKTFEVEPEYNLIFVAASLFCWILSIAFTFYWIFTQFNAIHFQMTTLDIILGHKDGVQPTIENIRYAGEYSMKILNEKSKKAGRAYSLMLYLFMSGILFFIAWRIAELFF